MSENKRRRITPQEEEDLNEVEETFEPYVTNLQSQIENPNIPMDIDYNDDVMPELTLEDLQVDTDPDEGITDVEISDDENEHDMNGGRSKKRTRRRNSKKHKKTGKRKTKRKKRIRKTRKIKRQLKPYRKTRKTKKNKKKMN